MRWVSKEGCPGKASEQGCSRHTVERLLQLVGLPHHACSPDNDSRPKNNFPTISFAPNQDEHEKTEQHFFLLLSMNSPRPSHPRLAVFARPIHSTGMATA